MNTNNNNINNNNNLSTRIRQNVFKIPNRDSAQSTPNQISKCSRQHHTDTIEMSSSSRFLVTSSASKTDKTGSCSNTNSQTTSNSLKSSVKRLFSPSNKNTQLQHLVISSHSTSLTPVTTPLLNIKKLSNHTQLIGSHSIRQASNSNHLTNDPSILNHLMSNKTGPIPVKPVGLSLSPEYAPLNLADTRQQDVYPREEPAEHNKVSNSLESSTMMVLSTSISSATSSYSNSATNNSNSTIGITNTSSISTCSSVSASSYQNKTPKKKPTQNEVSTQVVSKPTIQQQKATPTSTLKKHLNILKNNSKKVLLGSGGNGAPTNLTNNSSPSTRQLSSPPAKPTTLKPISTNSTAQNRTANTNASLNSSINTSPRSINSDLVHSQKDTTDTAVRIKDLEKEIERLSRLYDYEIGKKSVYEEKFVNLKQLAEEKQIETAAIKYEFRKVQELKENLLVENNYLKSLINTNQSSNNVNTNRSSKNDIIVENSPKILQSSTSSLSSPASKNRSPSVSKRSPCVQKRDNNLALISSTSSLNSANINSSTVTASSTSNLQIQAVQQAAAVAAAAAAANAASENNTNNSVVYDNTNNYHLQQHHHVRPQQQYNNLNVSTSISPSSHAQQLNTLQIQSNSPSQQQQQQKQYQYQQQQSVAAATAAAEYFEQQFKLQQHKNSELEQQYRLNLEQLKQLKETVDNLNDINRKLYDENQQYKDRSLDQRQQIEQYHKLFQENQQKNDQTLNCVKKERDESMQRENEIKRRLQQIQQQFDSKQQENYLIINSLKEKLEDCRKKESHLVEDLNRTKQDLKLEQDKCDLLDKKYHTLEKECCILKENFNLERNGLKNRINELEQQLDLIKDRYSNEKLKLEEKCVSERDELKSQLSSLESKFEEVIKEKAQILFKHGQLIENNRELNSLLQNKEAIGEQKLNETKTKLEYYINKCNDLEKEIAESQENHLRDTEEWKKFQADLQTAVRVANDFMNEAEEKMAKMKEDYVKTKEREEFLKDEIEMLKKKLHNQENLASKTSSPGYLKHNKENHDLISKHSSVTMSPSSTFTNSSSVRNLIESIESSSTTNTNVTVLTSLQMNSNHFLNSNDNKIHQTSASSVKYTLNNNNNSLNTDTDDAKMILCTRFRSNSLSTNHDESINGNGHNNDLQHLNITLNSSNSSNGENSRNSLASIKNMSSTSSLIIDSNSQKPYSNTSFSNISSNKNNQSWTPSSKSYIESSNKDLTNGNDALASLVKQYGVSKRNALMKWCQERVNMYKGVEIKNFSSSWNDGLAFCALIHSFLPSKIDYESLRIENNPRKNFQTAFKVAQSVGIPPTLNIHELLNHERPDWNAVMNYVTQIYKHFYSQNISAEDETGFVANTNKCSRSSSSSPTTIRNLSSSTLVQTSNSIIQLPLSLSSSSNSASSSSTNSNGSSVFNSASSSSSSISKTIC